MKTTLQLVAAALALADTLRDLDPGVWHDPVWHPKHMRVYRGFKSAVRKYLAVKEKKG